MINEQCAHTYCKCDISKIENYDKAIADLTHTWHLHHRLEFTLDGEFAHTKADLIRLGMYYNRPYFELIFLPRSEHLSMHSKGKVLSDEHRKKMSESHKRVYAYWRMVNSKYKDMWCKVYFVTLWHSVRIYIICTTNKLQL